MNDIKRVVVLIFSLTPNTQLVQSDGSCVFASIVCMNVFLIISTTYYILCVQNSAPSNDEVLPVAPVDSVQGETAEAYLILTFQRFIAVQEIMTV